MTAEQLEASRIERMRLNGVGFLTFEDARTWLEETGLCLFMPRRQYSAALAPSFVEAVAGQRNLTPDAKQVAHAEELLVRLENSDIAVRLNLLGQPGEAPDFVVATWVLPYVYALRGDRDWRRTPQLTGSRQVSPLAIQAYKLLEAAESTIPQLKHTLGREVTEAAVTRAITELWQQLRIIPVIAAPGQTPRWQLLRTRYQKAIAEGASTSQVTAISVLASIYLQAVIAGTMEDVELFLAPLTARSKVREVIRGLVATRQVHTMSLGHAPHFYVAGTLPEFSTPPTIYASSSMPASSYFLHSYEREEEPKEPVRQHPVHQHPVHQLQASPAPAAPAPTPAPAMPMAHAEPHQHRVAARKPAPKPQAARHFSRPAVQTRDRKPAQTSSNGRVSRLAKNGKHAGSSKHASAHSNGSSAHRTHANGTSSVRSGRPAANSSRSHKATPVTRGKHIKPAGKAGAKSRPHAVAAGAKSGRSFSGASHNSGHGSQRPKKRG